MSSINAVRTGRVRNSEQTVTNYHGLAVKKLSPAAQLSRLVLAHMLWEDQFYIDGKSNAVLMNELVSQVDSEHVEQLALLARTDYKLRHVPLILMRELARSGNLRADALAEVIQRPDEMSEFLALYWKDGKSPLSNQVKRGLAKAFQKFNEYQLAKWDKNSAAISLRDVMFLTHPKPQTVEQAQLFQKVANQSLVTPDTWETNLSAGANKAETFTRLMQDNKLGALAFLRNLRLMLQSGVDKDLILDYSRTVNTDRVLPFRFLAAARQVPELESMLEQMMLRSCSEMPKLPGRTLLMVDCSGSMFGKRVSMKSDLDRFDAAASLAMLCRELCEKVEIFGFADNAVRVPDRRGFALIEAIRASTSGGTYLGRALATANMKVGKYDRVIVFTDEQSSDSPQKVAGSKGYILNVAAYENGLNLDEGNGWHTITGFSEASLSFIRMLELQ